MNTQDTNNFPDKWLETTASPSTLAEAIPSDNTLETIRLDLLGTATSEGYEMKKAATQTNDNSFSLNTKKTISIKPAKQKVKEKALEAFLRAGRHGFYQIPAYKTFTVTCLHTYISNFEKKGLEFDREWIKHLNTDGDYTPFMRYWLADESAYKLALSMVNEMRSNRGLQALNDMQPYIALNQAT